MKSVMVNLNCGAFTVRKFADLRVADEQAERMYESIRKRTTDVANISNNLGLSYEVVSMIKQYLFFAQHKLYDNEVKRFDADLDIARSWMRLSEANRKHNKKFLDHDVILIKHEITEINILLRTKCTQAKAHAEAEKQYNYSKAADEYYEKFRKKG